MELSFDEKTRRNLVRLLCKICINIKILKLKLKVNYMLKLTRKPECSKVEKVIA